MASPRSSRLHLPDDQALSPGAVLDSIRRRSGGGLLNLDRALLRSPEFAQGWNVFLGAVRNQLSVPAVLRELVICAVAVLNRADYEMAQHAPEFLASGGTQVQLDALAQGHAAWAGAACFSALEHAALQLTREMTQAVQVSDACYDRLADLLANDQQCVELVGVIAAYNMVSRFLEALQVPHEAV